MKTLLKYRMWPKICGHLFRRSSVLTGENSDHVWCSSARRHVLILQVLFGSGSGLLSLASFPSIIYSSFCPAANPACYLLTPQLTVSAVTQIRFCSNRVFVFLIFCLNPWTDLICQPENSSGKQFQTFQKKESHLQFLTLYGSLERPKKIWWSIFNFSNR